MLAAACALFIATTAFSMWLYAGGHPADPRCAGYTFWSNFLSDLGMSCAWNGRPNVAGAVVFGVGVAVLGAALIAFTATWRTFAFGRRRGRGLGIAGQLLATASGLGFVGLAVTPFDRMISVHMAFVGIAFGGLVLCAACFAILCWINAATRFLTGSHLAYVAVLAGYLAVTAYAASLGPSWRARELLVGSQKLMALASMGYVALMTIAVRRQLAISSVDAEARRACPGPAGSSRSRDAGEGSVTRPRCPSVPAPGAPPREDSPSPDAAP